MVNLVISFGDKFGPRHLDSIASKVQQFLGRFRGKKNSEERILFDLSTLEWIAHEELVYLSALFHHLYYSQTQFYIKFRSSGEVSEREMKQIIRLWDNWRIHSFVKKNSRGFFDYNHHMDISDTYVKGLKEKLKATRAQVFYDRYNITPFVALPADIEEYGQNEIDQTFVFEPEIVQILNNYQSATPFLNKALQSIITGELFQNTVDHAFDRTLESPHWAYFGASLKHKLSSEQLHYNKRNFFDEELPETMPFFGNGTSFKNQSYIQFTFLDFGLGIPATLADGYEAAHKNVKRDDSEIIKYAFHFSSSRHSFSDAILNRKHLSRGLFDVLEIVRRYKGLIVIRSNYGRVIYNFADRQQQVIKSFGTGDDIFPGTVLSIYIPENKDGIKISSLKPRLKVELRSRTGQYLSIENVGREVAVEVMKFPVAKRKEVLYEKTFEVINSYLSKPSHLQSYTIIDFAGVNFNVRPTKRILHYLASTYSINESASAVIVNPPDKELVEFVRDEIREHKSKVHNFAYHPIPCLYEISDQDEFEIIWLGTNDEREEEMLTEALIHEIGDKRRDDFSKPDSVEGNVVSFDEYGNLVRNLPSLAELAVNSVLLKNILKRADEVFLTSGNYYQYEFVGFLEYLQDEKNCAFIVRHLFDKVKPAEISEIDCIVAITLSSQLLAKSVKVRFDERESGRKVRLVRLSNYHSFYKEKPFNSIRHGHKVLVVCDVISTGYLLKRVKLCLEKVGAVLTGCLSIVDTRRKIKPQEKTEPFELMCLRDDEMPTVFIRSLLERPIVKYTKNVHGAKALTRINPITNAPNTLSIDKSERDAILINKTEDFLNRLSSDKLKIGNFEQNEVEHSYWVEVNKFVKSKEGIEILADLIRMVKEKEGERHSIDRSESTRNLVESIECKLKRLKEADHNGAQNMSRYVIIEKEIALLKTQFLQGSLSLNRSEFDFMFYPIYSGVEEISRDEYRQIFDNRDLEVIPTARINTPKGWRFTFPPKFLNQLTKNKRVFIIDAGSISGDTLVQMIDEICYLDVRKITVLSVIGRVEDYQREFLSRIREVKTKRLTDLHFDAECLSFTERGVPISIYFGVHLHIPVFGKNTLNPFWLEKKRLHEYRELTIIPKAAQLYVDKRAKELESTYVTDIRIDYQHPDYLPTIRGGGGPPLVELFLCRDHIGKISGYRFFNEYFNFFDALVEFYSTTVTAPSKPADYYKQIELIVGVLVHESDLIQIIRDLVPDLHLKLSRILHEIVVEQSIKITNLTYNWEPYALLKCYFLVAKDELLQDEQHLKNLYLIFLFAQADSTGNALSYLSFAIFNELTHFKREASPHSLNDMVSNRLIQLKNEYSIKLDERSNRVIDNLLGYCNLNPYSPVNQGTLYYCEQLFKIYNSEKVFGRYHDGIEAALAKIDNQIQNLLVVGKFDKSVETSLTIIKNAWRDIKPTLEAITKLAGNLEDLLTHYHSGKLYNLIVANRFSLKSNIIYFDELLYSKDILVHLEEASEICKYFIKRVITRKSDCCEFFFKYKTDILKFYKHYFVKTLRDEGFQISEKGILQLETAYVDIHESIVDRIIFENLRNNIVAHADPAQIETQWEVTPKYYILTIKSVNKIKVDDLNQGDHKRSGLENMKKVCSHYSIEINYTDFEQPHMIFEVSLKFLKQNNK